MKNKQCCKHCGKSKEEHHKYEEFLVNDCVCHEDSWEPPYFRNKICDNYVKSKNNPSKLMKEPCSNCEHDKKCHKGN